MRSSRISAQQGAAAAAAQRAAPVAGLLCKAHTSGAWHAQADTPAVASQLFIFSGADLANLMNEAAILAARRNLKEISKVGARHY